MPAAGREVISTDRLPAPVLASPTVRVPVPAPPRLSNRSEPWLRTVPPT